MGSDAAALDERRAVRDGAAAVAPAAARGERERRVAVRGHGAGRAVLPCKE